MESYLVHHASIQATAFPGPPEAAVLPPVPQPQDVTGTSVITESKDASLSGKKGVKETVEDEVVKRGLKEPARVGKKRVRQNSMTEICPSSPPTMVKSESHQSVEEVGLVRGCEKSVSLNPTAKRARGLLPSPASPRGSAEAKASPAAPQEAQGSGSMPDIQSWAGGRRGIMLQNGDQASAKPPRISDLRGTSVLGGTLGLRST